MCYKFIPDSYNYNLMRELDNLGFDVFKLQIYYKQSLEKILNSIFNFSNIDKYLEGLIFHVPIINDERYNFYRKYSILNSKYVYLRNNIHIEKLTKEELSFIRESFYQKEFLDTDFIYKTLDRVLFENGDYTFFGVPILKNLVKSQSIVFEFAYNKLELKSIEKFNQIEKAYTFIFEKMKEVIGKRLNIPLSLIVYNSIPDNYKIESSNEIDNLNDLDDIII